MRVSVSFCSNSSATLQEWFRTHAGCDKYVCSRRCLERHKASSCPAKYLPKDGVFVSVDFEATQLKWQLVLQGFEVFEAETKSLVGTDVHVNSTSPGFIGHLSLRTFRPARYTLARGELRRRLDIVIACACGKRILGCIDHGLPFCFWHPSESSLWYCKEFVAIDLRAGIFY